MKIEAHHSHLNGEEYLLVHHKQLWDEIQEMIAGIDASSCRREVAHERAVRGKGLYFPEDLRKAFEAGLEACGWNDLRDASTVKGPLARDVSEFPAGIPKRKFQSTPILSPNKIDFVKDRVAFEVVLSPSTFFVSDLFAKPLSFYVSDVIDVGVAILPTEKLERTMALDVLSYERGIHDMSRRGRSVPAVPLVFLGVSP